MKSIEVDPREFVGCGLNLGEWVQLDDSERDAFSAARDGLLQELAERIVTTLAVCVKEAAEEMKLVSMVDKVKL